MDIYAKTKPIYVRICTYVLYIYIYIYIYMHVRIRIYIYMYMQTYTYSIQGENDDVQYEEKMQKMLLACFLFLRMQDIPHTYMYV